MNLNELMGDEDLNDLHVLDASNLISAALFANFKPEDAMNEEILRYLIFDTMRNNINRNREKYPDTVIAFDSDTGYWRRDFAWYYKKNRQLAKEESAWDWDYIGPLMGKIAKEVIEFYPGVTCIQLSKAEADDVIGVLVRRAVAEGRNVLVTSADGDFTQLQKYGAQVRQWSPTLKKFVKPKYGSPQHDLMTKVTKGDKKDGVAGIRVRSDFWVTREDGERTPPIKSDLIDKLANGESPRDLLTNKDELRRYAENRKLIDLEFIPKDICDSINAEYDKKKRNPRSRLYSYFVKHRMTKMLDKINDF